MDSSASSLRSPVMNEKRQGQWVIFHGWGQSFGFVGWVTGKASGS